MKVLDIGGTDNNNSPQKTSVYPSFRSFEKIQEEILKIKIGSFIRIKGGEPTIHPQFLEIITLLKKRNPKQIEIISNGRMFSYKEFCKNFNELFSFKIRVWGNKETHNQLTKTPESFEQTEEGIKNLIAAGRKVTLKIPLVKENLSSLKELMQSYESQDIFAIEFEHLKNIKEEITEEEFRKQVGEFFEQDPFLFSNDESSTDIKNKIDKARKTMLKKSLLYISLDETYRLLKEIQNQGDFWKFVYTSGYPIPIVVLLLDALEKEEILKIEGNQVQLLVNFKKINQTINLSSERLLSDPKLCQLTVSQSSLSKRVDYITQSCPSGGKVAVLGDDDFMSLSLASTGLFDKIVVFEIDKRVVEKIRSLAKEHNFNIKVIQHDLRQPLPKKYQEKFDIFYTDPPYSVNGFKLFISRGLSSLKKNPKCHGFSSFSCEIPILEGVEMPVQKIISDMGLFVETKWFGGHNNIPASIAAKYKDIHQLKKVLFEGRPHLEEVEEWFLAALGRKEFLFHFLTTDTSHPLITDHFFEEIYYEDKPLEFYTDEEYIQKMKEKFGSLNFL